MAQVGESRLLLQRFEGLPVGKLLLRIGQVLVGAAPGEQAIPVSSISGKVLGTFKRVLAYQAS